MGAARGRPAGTSKLAVRRRGGPRNHAPAGRTVTDGAITGRLPGAPAVELRELRRRFGANRVLKGIDLTVPSGASVVLTGANGAGKTTLLRILATLLRPTAGSGAVDGLSLADDGDRIRARTAYVSARGFVYDDLTAAENLRFAARLAETTVTAERIDTLIAEAGLSHASSRSVRTFSTGMRRRLALAALRLRPVRLALIDEPYGGLDSEGISFADRIVRDLVDEGTAVILASHQSGDATRTATRTLRLVEGRLVETAPVGAAPPGGKV